MSKSKDESKIRKRKSSSKDKSEDRPPKKHRKHAEAEVQTPQSEASFLDLKSATLDPTLSSLFSANGPVQLNDSLLSKSHAKSHTKTKKSTRGVVSSNDEDDEAADGSVIDDEEATDSQDDETLSSLEDAPSDLDDVVLEDSSAEEAPELPPPKRQRKKKDDFEDLENDYMTKLSKESEKLKSEARAAKKAAIEDDDNEQVIDGAEDVSGGEDDVASENEDTAMSDAGSDASLSPPPQHETLTTQDSEFEKAQRTVFLGNVSLSAVTNKSARTTLKAHLTSFSSALPASDETRALSSLRFRSTPFASAIPKRAAFAKQEIMDATAHCTNAYAVYSSAALARAAAQHLNGTKVLDRHLRVDSVAHPSPVDHKRCVFVGNLGFVDDESLVDAANAEQGREKRKTNKTPADVEEGLWRTFSKVGAVESVRVIRDSKTRVGKGIAYVQFKDENSVEEALLWDGKKDPPMLPRKLRVSRAKAQKRNFFKKKEEMREREERSGRGKGGYVPKLTNQQRSQMGRAERLLGKNAAKEMTGANGIKMGARGGAPRASGARMNGAGDAALKRPESFVFEGQRAKSGTDAGIKMKKGPGKKGPPKKAKPTKNSSKRAAAWKTKNSQE
ncbi:RNA recognition motif-containing protein 18 [Elsinoe australis]|uniref:Nucleolar protein 12 n=1 Tax=Elsinoe australis TaxID=40998 RepID=A0A4U7B315_9PEZI|nr:RNA recognition motif-containing protein 18 [Elsinoe australis]